MQCWILFSPIPAIIYQACCHTSNTILYTLEEMGKWSWWKRRVFYFLPQNTCTKWVMKFCCVAVSGTFQSAPGTLRQPRWAEDAESYRLSQNIYSDMKYYSCSDGKMWFLKAVAFITAVRHRFYATTMPLFSKKILFRRATVRKMFILFIRNYLVLHLTIFFLLSASQPHNKIICTSGGNLKCKNVIHLVAQVNINQQVSKALLECEQRLFTSVAFPAIGTGLYCFETMSRKGHNWMFSSGLWSSTATVS